MQDHGHLDTLTQKRVSTQIDAAYQTQTFTELGAIANLPTPTEFQERKAVSTTYTAVGESQSGQFMGLIVRLTETCLSPSSAVTLWHVSGGMGLDNEWWAFPYGCLALKKQRHRRVWTFGSFKIVVTPRTIDVTQGKHRAKLTLTQSNGWQALTVNKRSSVKGWAQLSEQTDCSNFVRDRWLKVTVVLPNNVLVFKSRVSGLVTEGQVLSANNDDAQIEILETRSTLSSTSGKPMFYPTRLKIRHKRKVYEVVAEFPHGVMYLPHGNMNGLLMGRIKSKNGKFFCSIVEAHQFMPEHDMVETTLRLANFRDLEKDDWRVFQSAK